MTTLRASSMPAKHRKGSAANSSSPAEARRVRALYRALLDAWNRQGAGDMAALFTRDANLVGFDGSIVNGRTKIASHLRPSSPATAQPRTWRRSGTCPQVAVLRAVAGVVPPGGTDLYPPVNAIQTLVAAKDGGEWCIAAYQNTPAAFHGRPEESERLTEELRQVLRRRT